MEDRHKPTKELIEPINTAINIALKAPSKRWQKSLKKTNIRLLKEALKLMTNQDDIDRCHKTIEGLLANG